MSEQTTTTEGFKVSPETAAYLNSHDIPIPSDPFFEGTVGGRIVSINDWRNPETGGVVIFLNVALEEAIKEKAVVEGQSVRSFNPGYQIKTRFDWICGSDASDGARSMAGDRKRELGVATGVAKPGELFSMDKLAETIGKRVILKLSVSEKPDGGIRQNVRFKKAASQVPPP